jgi:hypothetical protein
MATKILNSSIAKVACALLPICAFLVLGAAAYGQKSIPPGCVMRHDNNGKPYVFCKSEDNRNRENSVVRPQTPPSPLPQPSAPQDTSDRETTAPHRVPPGTPAATSPREHSEERTDGRPTALPGTLPSAAAPRATELRAVRALIEPAEMPPREVAGYGIVAFTTRPLPHDVERYEHVCEAYKATLTSQAELPPNTPLSEQMITYWPIANKNTPEARRVDCPHLLSNYALRLGLDAIQDADKQKEGLTSRRGPFLIAWAPSESRFVPDSVVLVMDLSALDGERSFTEVFQDWRQHITDNPELWRRGGFSLEAVRRIIRDTFDRYGDGLLRLIKS